MKEIKIKIYNFNELSEASKEKAYNDFLSFMEDMSSTLAEHREDVREALKRCEATNSPYFFREYLHEINGDGIREELAAQFEFFEDGRIFDMDVEAA